MPDEPAAESVARSTASALLAWAVAHLRPWLVAAVVAVFAFAVFREVETLDFHALGAAFGEIDPRLAACAFALALANVAGMGFYDVVALGRPWTSPSIPTRLRIGSLAFALSNLVATGPLAGPAVRLWLYRDVGAGAERIGRAAAESMVGLSSGHGILIAALWVVPSGVWWLALPLALGLAAAGGWALERLPRPRWLPAAWTSAEGLWPMLLAVGVLDWMIATAVFLLVLAAMGLGDLVTPHAALVFLIGHAAGAASLVPGGLGAADAAWLWGLSTPETANRVAAAIVVFRFFYYVVPFALAGFVLLTRRSASRPRGLRAARAFCAVAVATGGLFVLLSAATPAAAERLRTLGHWVPLGVIEASHLSAAIAGVLLLVLSRGLRRGSHSAMVVAGGLLVAGAAACLFKGGDFEEATLLGVVAALLFRHHRAFQKPGELAASIDWQAVGIGVAGTLVAAAVGLWAFREAAYKHDLWTEVALHAEVPRLLRGAGAALLLLALVAVAALLRPRRRLPTQDEVDRALALALAEPGAGSTPLMVANGDKLVWFHGERGFVLYATIGHTLVAFGDPVTPRGAERQCLEDFLEHVENEGWDVVFYQISPRWFPHLHDQGFDLLKLGEEAIVELAQFTTQGKAGKSFRYVVNQVEKAGVRLVVLEAAEVAARIGELRAVSDAWLATKAVAEKRFSVGFFAEAYLSRFPAIVGEIEGRIVAFANFLPGAAGGEASIDLMRQLPEAPEGVMEAILVRAMEWARDHGYARFSLGMAPLATVGESARAPLWERASRLVYRHGERFYNFRGLRQYKEKFHPRWEPRYMAATRAWDWPRLIATVAALVAGGWRRMVLPESSQRRGEAASTASIQVEARRASSS